MIKVHSIPHTLFAANHLVDQLNKLGYKAMIVDSIDCQDKSVYVIYNAALHAQLPKNYIVMQTEIYNSHWFNEQYRHTLSQSMAIWDYSKRNISAYIHENLKTCIVTPGIHERARGKKDIEFLFYGWIEGSYRRHRIIEAIKSEIPLTVITNTLKGEMWEMLLRAKVVINVHYSEYSPLELYRINESLSHGCHVVSEGYGYDYAKTVWFGDTPEALVTMAKIKSTSAFNYDLSSLDNTNEIIHGLAIAGI